MSNEEAKRIVAAAMAAGLVRKQQPEPTKSKRQTPEQVLAKRRAKYASDAARKKLAGLTTTGSIPKNKKHPELKGMTHLEYHRHMMRYYRSLKKLSSPSDIKPSGQIVALVSGKYTAPANLCLQVPLGTKDGEVLTSNAA